MADPVLVRRKLSKLVQYLRELESIRHYALDEYRGNHFIHRTAERLIQMIVEVATDINGHLIVGAGERPPGSYYESFVKLGELGILATELADELAPSAGLRNRLVHEYDEIDDEVVHRSIGTTLDLYRRYVAGVELYLEENMMPYNRSD